MTDIKPDYYICKHDCMIWNDEDINDNREPCPNCTIDALMTRVKELEARCENDEKSIHYLHEELAALKQWQREVLPFLITSASNRRAGYRDFLLDLIKQAEGK